MSPLAYSVKDKATNDILIEIDKRLANVEGKIGGKLSHKDLKDIGDHKTFLKNDGSVPLLGDLDLSKFGKVKNTANRILNTDINQGIVSLNIDLNQLTVDQTKIDHGLLLGLADDDHPQYGALAQDETVTGSWTFEDDVKFANAVFPIIDKASGNGIKVDTTTPTFGFADIIGDQFSKNTGATKPTLATYNGDVDAWQFSDGDEAFITFHIPHDYVPGTDIHLHVHWSQTSATATGGTLDFKYFAIYAKAHNQASGSTFTSTPITATFSSIDINDGASGLNQYQQFLTEVTISAASATAALFDRDDLEPDGVIELTFEMDANNLTNSVAVLDPFIHYVDIHYQTTSITGTKSRTPDFYA